MTDDLARAVAFEDVLRERSVDRIVPCAFGHALLTESLPLVWDLNFVRVEDAGDASAADVAAEAKRVHAAAGHAHRRVVFRRDPDGRRLAPGFAELGWTTERLLFMAHRRATEKASSAPVEEVGRETVAPLREAFARQEPWATSEEVVRQVLAKDARLADAGAGAGRHFAVLEGGAVAACADLYSDGRTAQIEDVVTLPEFRGRGYASAVVLHALAAGQESGHDFVFLVADEDDWPQKLYARLGFEPIGRTYSSLKPPAPHAGPAQPDQR